MVPADGTAIAIRHYAVKLTVSVAEHQRKKVPIALPQLQSWEPVHLHPEQLAVGVLARRFPLELVHQEDKPKPVLAVLAEPRPADGSPQLRVAADDACLLLQLTPEAAD